jgi:chromosome partitioning protein
MLMTLSVLNQKGGAGKTTIAVHLAAALSRQGAKVLLIDADPAGHRSRLVGNPLR